MRIAVLDDYQQVAGSLADWSTLEAENQFFPDHIPDGDQLMTRLAGFDVVVAMRERTPFPRPVLEGLPDLRLLVTTGSANASIDVKAAQELGVVVSGTGALAHPTAELTFALILTLSRGLVDQVGSVRGGGWQVGLGRDLLGSTLGVIGLGRLGSQVARLGQAFGMDVLAWSHNLTRERAAEVGVSQVSMDELLRRADFVTIHLRLSDRTGGLIGRDELALMKPDRSRATRLDAIERAHLRDPGDTSHVIHRHEVPPDLADLARRFWIPVWSVPPGEESIILSAAASLSLEPEKPRNLSIWK